MATLIPIQNLYYLLCYAWGLPEQRDWVSVDADSCPSVVDLMARLVCKGADVLLKRGLAKEYVAYQDEIAGVKGKLELTETLKRGLYREGKTVCSIDDLTGNILLNQIVYTTLYKLVGDKELKAEIHNDLRRTFLRFPKVDIIFLSPSVFKKVRLNRNNRFYRLIVNVCQLLYEQMLPDKEHPGEYKFIDFTRDEDQMNRIFEAFLLNFYQKESSDFYPIVRSTKIHFQLKPLEEEDDLLPEMITDVTLDNPKEGRRIILDAKYYQEMFSSRFEGGTKKLRREHISQIQSYIDNQEDPDVPYTLRTNGIMVYPMANVQFTEANYQYRNHRLRFCALDLAQDWRKIDQRLRKIINFE